jgi:flagellar assembly factor FliW
LESSEGENLKQIETKRFGRFTIDDESIITFPDGLIDFRKLRQFVIVGVEDYLPFLIFASLDHSRVCFPIINPLPIFPEYQPRIRGVDMEHLGVDRKEDVQVYCLTIFAGKPRRTFINLKNPIVINVTRMLGSQVDLKVESYHHRTPFDLDTVASQSFR